MELSCNKLRVSCCFFDLLPLESNAFHIHSSATTIWCLVSDLQSNGTGHHMQESGELKSENENISTFAPRIEWFKHFVQTQAHSHTQNTQKHSQWHIHWAINILYKVFALLEVGFVSAYVASNSSQRQWYNHRSLFN